VTEAPLTDNAAPAVTAPFRLDTDDDLRVVEQGALDVFLQRRGVDGAPAGARHALYRATAGLLVPGMVSAWRVEALHGWGVVAVPLPGTRLRVQDEVVSALQVGLWLEALSDGREPLAVCEALQSLAADRPEAAVATAAACRAAIRQQFAQVLVARIDAQPRIAALEQRRLLEKAGAAARLTGEALAQLLLTAEDDDTAPLSSPRTGRLLAALAPIGRTLGVSFVLPPRAESEAFAEQEVPMVCAASRVRWRQVKLGAEWWRHDCGPLLGSIGDSREWVALLQRPGGGYLLLDPDRGGAQPLTPALADTLGAFGWQFYPGLPDTALGLGDLLRLGLRGLQREIRDVVVLNLLLGMFGVLVPIAMGVLIDTLIPTADLAGMWQMVGALMLAALASAVLGIGVSVGMLRLESSMTHRVQAALWDRLLKLPVGFFRKYATGDLAVRVNSVNTILRMVGTHATRATTLLVLGLFNTAMLFWINPALAGLALLLLFPPLLLVLVTGRLKLGHERALSESTGRMAALTYQYLRGIAKIRVAAAEARVFANWSVLFGAIRTRTVQSQQLANLERTAFGGYQLVQSAAVFGLIGFGLLQGQAGGLSTGAFVAFSAALGVVFASVMGLADTVLALLVLVPVYERARPILETLPEAAQRHHHPGRLQGGIEVSHIGFAYAAGTPILDDVSFSVAPGSYLAVVGPSGSGKSTLLRLLLGFEQPECGTIHYDRQNLAQVDIQALRRQFGVVLQNGQLLAGDIFSNIAGGAVITLEQAWAAAQQVGLDEDIRQMPMGMHTVISEGSSTLSGGQRQRILIARAIVHHPRVLFFDEATSALDNRTQAIVTESLARLRVTRVVIAHRLSTIREADRILVLVGGKIVQDGSYGSLSQVAGPFREMALRQTA